MARCWSSWARPQAAADSGSTTAAESILFPTCARSGTAAVPRSRTASGPPASSKISSASIARLRCPWCTRARRVERLFRSRGPRGRQHFYDAEWNNRRWRWMARAFFSRTVIGRLGRDPHFFDYVEGSVSEHLLRRAGYALTALDPCANPYLQWLLLGCHRSALPYALRPENFEAIRENLDRLDVRLQSLEEFIDTPEASDLDGFNLSDIFEYMSERNAHRLLEKLVSSGRRGARLVYWNLLAPRRRPDRLAHRLRPLEELAAELLRTDKAFFYSALNVEEVR